jgi:hypothetical protein
LRRFGSRPKKYSEQNDLANRGKAHCKGLANNGEVKPAFHSQANKNIQ